MLEREKIIALLLIGTFAVLSLSGLSFSEKESEMRESIVDIPTWYIGDSWSYHRESTTTYIETGDYLTENDDITYIVESITTIEQDGNSYDVYILNGTGSGTGSGSYEGVPYTIEGEIQETYWIRLSDLAIVKYERKISGTLYIWIIPRDYYNNETVKFSPPKEEYDFPVFFNDIWHISTQVEYNGDIYVEGLYDDDYYDYAEIDSNVSFMGEEDLTVPAGDFETYHIKEEGTSNGTDENYTNELWFSPDVKNYVRQEYKNFTTEGGRGQEGIVELTSYSLASEPISVQAVLEPAIINKGGNLKISGASAPNAEVIVTIPSIQGSWSTGTNGYGDFIIEIQAPNIPDDTPSPLDFGSHGVIVTVIDDGDEGHKVMTLTLREPDLYIYPEDITFIPEKPNEGNVLTILADVHTNESVGVYTEICVAFYIDDELLGYSNLTSISAGSYEGVSMLWNATAGVHAVKIRLDPFEIIEESNEENNEAESVIDVNALPVADFSMSSSEVKTNVAVSFDASLSYDPDGNIENYTWNFGDGSFSYGEVVSHAYSDGTVLYNVTLTVRDNNLAESKITKQILVHNVRPVAEFTASTLNADTNVFIGFNASLSYDTDGNIIAYYWDFDDKVDDNHDGNYTNDRDAEGIAVLHSFTDDGSYKVTLTCIDDDLQDGTASKIITINNVKPLAFIDEISPMQTREGQEIYFSGHGNDTDGSIVEYYWESSIDGILSDKSEFSTTELSAGEHSITFKVKDDDNAWSDEMFQTITVLSNEMPEIQIIFPKEGDDVHGIVKVNGTSSDDEGVIKVEVSLDSTDAWKTAKDVSAEKDWSIWEYEIDFTGLIGEHTIYARAFDGYVYTMISVNITVLSLDVLPPEIEFVGLEEDLQGIVIIRVNASDNSGIERVEFYVDGILVLKDYDYPYEYEWNTFEENNGEHQLEVIAYDNNHNSAGLKKNVTVSNNHAPELSGGRVEPSEGSEGSLFTFFVSYTDADNDAPLFVEVVIDGKVYEMIKLEVDNDYTDGCIYSYPTKLRKGEHTFYFRASDGINITESGNITLNVKDSKKGKGFLAGFEFIAFTTAIALFVIMKRFLKKEDSDSFPDKD